MSAFAQESTTPVSHYPTIRGWVSAHRIVFMSILILSLVVRCAFLVYTPPSLGDDTGTYLGIAQNLISGNGYSHDGLTPTRVRTPTYPVFIALIQLIFGFNPHMIVLIQIMLGVCTVGIIYLLASRVFDRRTGLLAALIVAFYPALVYYDTRILREGLTTFLVTSILFFTIRSNAKWTILRLFAIGALLATISMCRPETIVLFGPVIYLLNRPIQSLRNTLKPALLIALPILMVWTPWMVRSYVTFGTFSPVTFGLGSVLWQGSRWAAIGGEAHTAGDRKALKQESQTLWQGSKEADYERRFMDGAIQDIRKNPGWFFKMILVKTKLFWKDANGVNKTLPALHPALPPLLNTWYYGLLALAIAAILARAKTRQWVLPLAVTIFTYMMTYALLHVRNRYRVPILPLVFVLSAGGFWALYDILKNQIRTKWRLTLTGESK